MTVTDAGIDGIFDDLATTPGTNEFVDNNSLDQSFTIVIDPVNDAPTINTVVAPAIVEQNIPSEQLKQFES